MFCLFIGFGVVPGDVWDGFTIDVGVVVCGRSEGEMLQLVCHDQMITGSELADPFHGQTVLCNRG